MFTSRLPMSTSVRRPTNPNDNRQSNIPVTVKKANLFTPQTKRPFSLGTSTAGKSFTSGPATEKKFQRSLKPAPDRDAQQQMFDHLTDFIRSNAPGFPCPEAKKFFSSVSTTESTRIFELLIGRIIPDFKINRLEIDVPEALNRLNYPFIRSVTKSSLVSVTTRQAAAGLLHIFDWLVRLVIPSETDGSELCEDEDPLSVHCTLDPTTAYEKSSADQKEKYSGGDAGRLDEGLDFAFEEEERLGQQLNEIYENDQILATIEEDNRKCLDYRSQMKMYSQTKIDESEEIQQQLSDKDAQREDYLGQINHLNHEINFHKLDIDQAKREHERLGKLEHTLQNFLEQRVQADAELKHVDGNNQRELELSQKCSSDYAKQLTKILDTVASMSVSLELPQILETEEDSKKGISSLRACASEVDAVISNGTSDELAQLQQVEAIDAKYPTDIFPLIHEEMNKFEREREVVEKDHTEAIAYLETRLEDIKRQAKQQEQDSFRRNASQREKYDRVVGSIEEDQQNYNRLLKKSRTHLEIHLEDIMQRVSNLTKDAKQEAEEWTEAQKAWENKKLIMTKAVKLLNGYPGLA